MKKLLLLLLLSPFIALAQVGINTTAPNAALDIQSTNNGVLIPRVQLTDALDIVTVVNPAGGVLAKSTLVYNIGLSGIAPDNVIDGFYYWNGVRWMPISGSPNWSLKGNTGISQPANPTIYGTSTIAATENFIGTKDNNDVTIATDNIERMRIKNATGNVGVGIANPSSTLEINSGGTTELKLSSRGAFGTTRFSMISDKELPNEWRPTYIQSADNGGFTGRMDFFTNGTGIANKFGSLRAMSITNGNVGIGTANPTKKLDIVAPNNEIGLRILSGNNSELSYLSIGRTTEYAQIGACITSRFFLDALDGDMAIKNFGAGKILFGASVNTNADMSIVPGGNVGIGTVTPTLAKLQVNGMVGNTSAVFKASATGTGIAMVADYPGLYFNCYYNGGQRTMAPYGFPSIVNSDQGIGGLTFHTSNIANTASDALLATNIPERMRIDADGEVGIGTNNPLAKLHIVNSTSGAIRIEDGTQANGNVLRSDANGVGTWQNPNTFSWSLTGNTVNATTHFLGSTNNADVIFKRNNLQAGFLGSVNTSFGQGALINYALSPFSLNTAFGRNALAGDSTTALNTGSGNTAVGVDSLSFNTAGSSNTALGYLALSSNKANNGSTAIGFQAMIYADDRSIGRTTANTAVGYNALSGSSVPANNTGINNTAIGYQSLEKNTSGSNNTSIGSNALYVNTTGSSNTAIGTNAGASITTAVQNVAIGNNALDSNIISGGNTAVGYDALQATNGDFNTAFGNSSLFSLVAGTSNCAFGYNALTGLTSGTNNIGIGTNTVVPLSTGSNQIRMGNTAITYAGIQVAWTITSDKRWKTAIQTSNLGLNFINKLHPVSYIRKNDESKKTEYGFIAQELDQTLNEFGATDSGIINKDDAGMMSVRYNDLLAPIVKAIQELKAENDTLKEQNATLNNRLKALENK